MTLRDGLGATLSKVRQRLTLASSLGYCVSGTVLEASEEARRDFAPGDRVACSGAGHAVHAEVVAVPRNLAVKIPAGVTWEQAAFAPLGAIAMHGLRQAQVQLGESVAVIGLGLVGLLSVELARAAGCRVLAIDLQPRRVALAEKVGAQRAVTRETAEQAALEMTGGKGLDKVLVCADSKSSDPMQLAAAISRSRGTVVVVGAVEMNMDRSVFYAKELELKLSRSLGPGRYDPSYEQKGLDYPYDQVRWTENRNMESFIDLVASGKLSMDPLITHRFAFEKAPEAYSTLSLPERSSLGVLLRYPAEEEHPPALQRRRVSAVQPGRGGGRKVPLALLGAGSFSKSTLMPAIAATGRAEPKLVVSAGGLSSLQLSESFGFHDMATDEAEIWSDPGIEAVVIATRHHLHARQVLSALQVGKHVFVEKPLCLNREELAEINSAYEQAQTPQGAKPLLVVGFNRRFAPLMEQLRQALAPITDPLYVHYTINAGYIPPEHWTQDLEQGGGRIIGEVCHFADILCFLTGARPERVFAAGLDNTGRYRDDNLAATVSFSDGSVGVISYLACGDPSGGKESVEVHGGGLSARMKDFSSLEIHRNSNRKQHSSKGRFPKGHQRLMDQFLAAVKEAGPPPIGFDEIVQSTELTLAILDSLRGKKPVALHAGTASPG
ncbi:MAG: bi-domain-containing oxidoreductase [Proteobacteria bacterium]|nr:bi-domain-containing oxidoreductase [Pseudomonadota bacterium]